VGTGSENGSGASAHDAPGDAGPTGSRLPEAPPQRPQQPQQAARLAPRAGGGRSQLDDPRGEDEQYVRAAPRGCCFKTRRTLT
jgi:hypothetical protein